MEWCFLNSGSREGVGSCQDRCRVTKRPLLTGKHLLLGERFLCILCCGVLYWLGLARELLVVVVWCGVCVWGGVV